MSYLGPHNKKGMQPKQIQVFWCQIRCLFWYTMLCVSPFCHHHSALSSNYCAGRSRKKDEEMIAASSIPCPHICLLSGCIRESDLEKAAVEGDASSLPVYSDVIMSLQALSPNFRTLSKELSPFPRMKQNKDPWIFSHPLVIHYDCLRTSSMLIGGWKSDLITRVIIIKTTLCPRQFTRSGWTAAHGTSQTGHSVKIISSVLNWATGGSVKALSPIVCHHKPY